MPFVIDGSNVGGRLKGATGSRDRQAVVELVLPWCRGRRQVELVFDGEDDGSVAIRYGSLRVVSSSRQSADDYIFNRLRSQDPANWTVVTDDRALAARCRQLGARIETSTALIKALRTQNVAKADEKPRAVNVAEWEAYFRMGSGEEGVEEQESDTLKQDGAETREREPGD